jgi:hypothetical protein
MGISLHKGPIGEPEGGGGSVYWEFWEIVEGGLQKWSISPCGSFVRGTWRRGSFAGDMEGYVEEGSGDRSLEEALFSGDLCVEEGSGDGHLSP